LQVQPETVLVLTVHSL